MAVVIKRNLGGFTVETESDGPEQKVRIWNDDSERPNSPTFWISSDTRDEFMMEMENLIAKHRI